MKDFTDLPEKQDINNTIFFLFVFSLMLGVELGTLIGKLDAHGSIILTEPILSTGNLILFIFAVISVLLAIKEPIFLLRCSYIVLAVQLLLNPSVIGHIGYKSLYAVRIGALFIITICLMKSIRKTFFYTTLPWCGMTPRVLRITFRSIRAREALLSWMSESVPAQLPVMREKQKIIVVRFLGLLTLTTGLYVIRPVWKPHVDMWFHIRSHIYSWLHFPELFSMCGTCTAILAILFEVILVAKFAVAYGLYRFRPWARPALSP